MSSKKYESGARLKHAYWQRHIEDCQRNHLSQKDYCRAHGLALSTFRYWKKKLGTETPDGPRFYPLTVQHDSPQAATLPIASGLSLQLASGKFNIELAENFSAGCLKKLIHTLEEL